MVMLPDAQTPPGLRLYAIGDVHGRTDLLVDMHQRIARDLERRPVADWRVIHLGDYVDRGPDSAGTLELLHGCQGNGHSDFLLGNHDRYLLDFLTDPQSADLDRWVINGAIKTMDSFGIDGMRMVYSLDDGFLSLLHDALTAAMQPWLPEFLGGLQRMLRYGDYVFVHAGVRPEVALEDQIEHDLIWIREPFLSSAADLGAVIVHGHTPVDAVEVRRNRIGIDTGAVFTGNLTCLVLEGAERALLGTDRLEPLADAAA
ncbi:MAG TPA: metallophosphoesterase [Thermohalobaculum sp.]|nr:metallophosphoesterase [Thermohalobaculum sp.]